MSRAEIYCLDNRESTTIYFVSNRKKSISNRAVKHKIELMRLCKYCAKHIPDCEKNNENKFHSNWQ